MNIAAFRQSSWIVTAPLTAASLVYVAFVWLPGTWAIQAMEHDLAARQQFIEQSTARQTSLPDSLLELESAKLIAEQWEKVSPRKRELSTLHEKLNSLAQSSGLAVQQCDPRSAASYEKVCAVPITMVGTGEYAQLYEFIRSIEGLPMVVWIRSMKIEKMAGRAKDVRCQMELVVFANNS